MKIIDLIVQFKKNIDIKKLIIQTAFLMYKYIMGILSFCFRIKQ